MHTITLEDAIDLFRLPRTLGADKDEEVSVGVGRFGPFAKRGSVYASLKKEDDPYTIDLARAVFLIEEKEEIARNRIIKEFPDSDIQVLNGRYGPYLSDGKLNGKIPKDREPASLTFEEVVTLMEETGKPMRKGFGKKVAKKVVKKATKKTAAAPAAGTATSKATKKATKKTAKKATKKAVKKAPATKAVAAAATPAVTGPVAKKAVARKTVVKKTAAQVSGAPLDDDAPF